MPGSKKGERRGNARKRPETPNDVMRDATRQRAPMRPKIEERIEIARTLHGHSGEVRDMTPREVMLDNMHYSMQAAFDWQSWVMQVAAEPMTPEMAKKIATAEGQVERYRASASEDAFKLAPYIHPRLSAVAVQGSEGRAPDIIQALLDDIDQRQRDPRVIEHQASGKIDHDG